MTQHKNFKVRGANGTVMQVGYLKKAGAVVSILGPDAGASPVTEKYSDIEKSNAFQKWGANNDQPTIWRQKIEGSTTAYPFIARLVEIIFGKGPIYYQETYDKDGNATHDFTRITEIDDFIYNNDLHFFLLQRMMDYKFCNNIFCEFILNKGLSKITNISHLEAEFTRFGEYNDETKKFDTVKYTGDWNKPDTADTLPFLNRQDKDPAIIKTKFIKDKKFVYHSFFPSPGRTIYAFPPHGAAFKKDGWMDFSNKVPEIMNQINDNAMNLKYHIRIPYDYWPAVHKDWNMLDSEKQKVIIDTKLAEIEDFLVGTKNAGKAFYSHFATDPVTGKPLAGWEIITLDDKSKKDAYLTSVNEADIQVSRAFNLDSSLTNIQPQGGKMGAGSGSDKRVGMDNQINTSYASTSIIFEPLYLVGMFNGWPKNLKWGFIYDVPVALNQSLTGNKTTL